MKLFVKMLTLASIVMTGTAAWADPQAVIDSYNNYREVYDTYSESSTQSKKVGAMWRQALIEHEAVCKKNCTPSTCGNKNGNNVCITSCPTISNCMKGNVNNHIKVLAAKDMKLDKNGIPVKNAAPASDIVDDVEEEAAPPALARRSSSPPSSRVSGSSSLRTTDASLGDDSLDEEEEGIGSALKRTATQAVHGVIKKGAAVVAPLNRSRSSSLSGGQDESGSCSANPNLARLEAAAIKATVAATNAAAAAKVAAAAATNAAASKAPAPRTAAPTAALKTPAPAPASKAPAPVAAVVVEAPPAAVPVSKSPCELAGEANGMSPDDAQANGLC